jgi:ribosome assembly protein YihI (activator of Der GTPase)
MTEIDYRVKFLKTKYRNENTTASERNEELQEIYEKSLDTLEVLMNKMGLRDKFDRVMEQYEEQMKQMPFS